MEQLLAFENITSTLKSLFLTLAIGLWLIWLWSRRHLYEFSMKFPGPFGLPILGISYRLKQPKEIFPTLSNIFEDYQVETFCTWVGFECFLITRDPEIAKQVLSSTELLNKATVIYDNIYTACKGGLVGSPLDEWQHNRKLINPSFNHKVLLSFFPIFHKAKLKMISKFSSLVGNGETKLYDLLQQLVLGISVETTMGKIIKEGDEEDIQYIQNMEFILKGTIEQILLSFLKLNWIYFFHNRYHKALNYSHNFVNELIKHKLQKLSTTEIEENHSTMTSNKDQASDNLSIKKQPNIFIDQAIKLYKKNLFKWNDIVGESFIMVLASYETTSGTVFSVLAMLAMHPEVQEKVYEEIVNAFPEKDFEMTNDDMTKLPYLEMVINETLRLVPPIPLIARQVVDDYQLTEELFLPKNLAVLISIYHLHRSTKVWGPNAHKFNPDNFLPENLSTKHSNAFMPFSKGARNCIGWRYAYMTLKVLLVAAVRNFKFSTSFKFEDLRLVEHTSIKYLVEPELEIYNR